MNRQRIFGIDMQRCRTEKLSESHQEGFTDVSVANIFPKGKIIYVDQRWSKVINLGLLALKNKS